MSSTKIEWADAVWNPVTGCTKVSEGCRYCYAERMAWRFKRPWKVTLHMDRLGEPSHWRKPRRVFVCSMGDLFHKDVPNNFITDVFQVIRSAPQHQFLILTKRPERMATGLQALYDGERPLSNVWLGVSVENQATADERIPLLLKTPAAMRFVSYEPALGPVNFGRWLNWHCTKCGQPTLFIAPGRSECCGTGLTALHWIICGGESGPGARPMHPDWARSVRDQCQAAGVPFFFKQWGEFIPDATAWLPDKRQCRIASSQGSGDGYVMLSIGKKRAGRLLDGREWNEYPEATP